MAQALRRALERAAGPRIQVWIDDLYVELGRPPLSGFPLTYAVVTRRFPALWRFVYDEGMIGLGPERNMDWMHIQAARL